MSTTAFTSSSFAPTASWRSVAYRAGQTQLSGPGTLTVPAAVVAKIAAEAAAELPTVGAASGGILGLGARRDFADRPRAEAELYGNTAVITVDLGIAYPTPLRAAAETIRAHIARRVGELTGLAVEQVDLEISWLHPATTAATRGALQ